MRFTIIDECILSGTYASSQTVEDQQGRPATVNGPGIAITSTDCKEYQVSDHDIAIYPSSNPSGVRFINTRIRFTDRGDNTLDIPDQQTDALPDSLATLRGSGQVNPQNGEIILNVTFADLPAFSPITIRYNREQ
jgi:hypothetical protein